MAARSEPALPDSTRRSRKQHVIYGSLLLAVATFALALALIARPSDSKGTLAVQVNERDAKVDVFGPDGKDEIRRAAADELVTVPIEPGQYRLQVSKRGFASYTTEFTIESVRKETFLVWLEPVTDATRATLTSRVESAVPERDTPPLDSSAWTWSAPVNVGPSVNTMAAEFGPAVSDDELTLYFASDRPGGQGGRDLWQSTRSSVDEPFGTPVNLGPAVNSRAADVSPDVANGGLILVFASERPGGRGQMDLWMSRRASTAQPFGKAVNLGTSVCERGIEDAPTLSSDALILMFVGTTGNSGRYDLKMSRRSGVDEDFGGLMNMGPLIDASNFDRAPSLSADGLTVVFTRNYHLYFSTRATVNEPFPKPTAFPAPLHQRGFLDPELSADGKTLYFSSKQLGGRGSTDLWYTRRVPLPPANR